MGRRVGQNTLGKKKIVFPLPGFEPQSVQSVAQLLYRMDYPASIGYIKYEIRQAIYSRINSTKSQAKGAGNVSEPMLLSQVGRVREVVCE